MSRSFLIADAKVQPSEWHRSAVNGHRLIAATGLQGKPTSGVNGHVGLVAKVPVARTQLRLTGLSPALPLAAAAPRPHRITLAAPTPRSCCIPRSGLGGLAVTRASGRGTTQPTTHLRIAAKFASAIVMRVWRHDPPMRTLRRNVLAGRFSLFALSHDWACKAAEATD